MISLLVWPSFTNAADMAGMDSMANVHAIFIDQFEWQGASTFALEAEGWYGDELQKIAYKVEAEKEPDEDTHSELTLGWQTGISAFWDSKLALRHDKSGHDERNWVGGGFSGTAPYFVHVDGMLFTGEGDFLLSLKAEHKIPLTRHWLLKSSLELEAVSGDESGFSEIEAGVRVHYETVKRWTAYTGIEWHSSPLEDESDTAIVLGFSYWY